MFLNKKYGHVGHIFQGRFQSIIVEKDNYLLQVHRYIHLNPVKAGLVPKPEDYQWSSYLQYVSNSNHILQVDTSEVLGMTSQDKSKQKLLFQEFTLAGIADDFDPFKKQIRGVLGSSKFNQKLTRVSKGIRP